MPLSTSALLKPYLATTGHNSGGASSTLGQPKWTAVSQMRSIFQFHSVALRHQYASDCLMRPFVTTRYLRIGSTITFGGQIRPNLATASLMDLNFSMKGSMVCSVLSSSSAFLSTSAARALGTTATPSSSATMISPGFTRAPAQVTGMFTPAKRKWLMLVEGATPRLTT